MKLNAITTFSDQEKLFRERTGKSARIKEKRMN